MTYMKIHMCILYWPKLSGCIITENEKAYFVMKTISSSFVTIKDFKYQMMHYFCHICSMGSKGLTQQFTHKATLPRLLDKVVNQGFSAQFCDKLNPMYDTNWSTTILLLKSRKCHLIMLDICESWRKNNFVILKIEEQGRITITKYRLEFFWTWSFVVQTP